MGHDKQSHKVPNPPRPQEPIHIRSSFNHLHPLPMLARHNTMRNLRLPVEQSVDNNTALPMFLLASFL